VDAEESDQSLCRWNIDIEIDFNLISDIRLLILRKMYLEGKPGEPCKSRLQHVNLIFAPLNNNTNRTMARKHASDCFMPGLTADK
jgi:hypothetical protein